VVVPALSEASPRAWWAGLTAVFHPPPPPQPGLHTYRVALPGGQTRIHLRIDQNGSGILFVDVTEAIHLNATGAEMVKLALDGVPQGAARVHLARRYARVSPTQLQQELARMYALVETLRQPPTGCPTCALGELEHVDLFSKPVNAPYKVDLALTYECNNACAHCYNEPGRFTMASLTTVEWLRVLDVLAELGVPHLIFTGGEPTLYPDLLTLIRHAENAGQITGINTNGRRLSDLAYTQALAQAGLDHVQITLAAHDPELHNAVVGAAAFAQTVRGIENALAAGLHTITNTTLTRRTVGQALTLVDFLHGLGLRTFAMNGMIYAGGGVADPEAIPTAELEPVLCAVRDRAVDLGMRFLWYTPTEYCQLSPVALGLGPKRCNAGEYSMCIEPNGDVLPCQSYYVTAGNILHDPWGAIWDGALFHSFRDREEDPVGCGLPEMCWDCPDLALCAGGCRLEREARQGVRAAERGCGRARSR